MPSPTRPTPGPQNRPPFDPELEAALDVCWPTSCPPTITPEMIPLMREAGVNTAVDDALASDRRSNAGT